MTIATRQRIRINCHILGPISLLIVLLSGVFPASVPASTNNVLTDPPTSRIIYPNLAGPNGALLRLGETLTVRAAGEDPDSSSSTGLPVAYLFKVLRLDTLNPPYTALNAPTSLLMQGGDSTWTRYEGDTLDVSQPLAVPGEYMVGVRAIGEGGAIEGDLLLRRNVFKFQAFANAGRPDITLKEPSAGSFFIHDSFVSYESEVPANTPLLFSWIADASRYGGSIDAYSWGLDLADVNSETGWSSWSDLTSTAPLVFQGGTHFFYIRAQDSVGAILLGTLTIHVVEMAFDREVLLVDDSFDNLAPNDSENDAFWQDLVNDYVANSDLTSDQFSTFSVFGDGDRGNLEPNAPTLSELGRYKVVIWDNLGTGYNSQSALCIVTALTNRLAAYLRAGGKLWLQGRMTAAATIADVNGVGADLTYPITTLGPGFFAWDYLKLQTTKINNDKGTSNANLFHAARWFPGVTAIYDTMSVDVNKLNLFGKLYGGFSYADAVFNPISLNGEPGQEGILDTLYAYGAAGPEVQGLGSIYNGKLCAVRWHSLSPHPTQGRVQWFGFSMYYMKTDQARNTFRQSLDWLRQNDGATPVQHVSYAGGRNGSNVVIRWDVAEDWQSSSFSVYREEAGHEREKVSAAFSSSLHYEFVDRNAPSGAVSYWLNEQDRAGTTSWYGPIAVAASVGERRLLAPVLPNPVMGRATLAYTLETPGHVALTVLDISGRQVAMLVNGTQDAGRHELTWNPIAEGHLSAGVYVLRITTAAANDVRKVLVLR